MKLGIIGAMDVEVERLVAQVEDARVTRHARMDFTEGTLFGLPVVVVRCGVGKVHAAACVQSLVDLFGVTHVVNTGAAGSLDARLDIGDILMSLDVVHHDVDATNFGYAPGEVPGSGMEAYPADAALVEAVQQAAQEAGASCAVGRVATGDSFVRDAAEKDRIARTFQARCCEMEGAAIAQACWLNDVPFVVVRAISDKADGSDALDYPIFERRAAHACSEIVMALARLFARDASATSLR